MQDLLRRIIVSFLVACTLLSVAAAVRYLVPRWHLWQENRLAQEQLQAQVEDIRQQITATKRNIDRFRTSPYFVERLARANHRVAENEIIFIFD